VHFLMVWMKEERSRSFGRTAGLRRGQVEAEALVRVSRFSTQLVDLLPRD
jgi:hypothetical protein